MIDINEYYLNQVRALAARESDASGTNFEIFHILLEMRILATQLQVLGPYNSGIAVIQEGIFKGMKMIYPLTWKGTLLAMILVCMNENYSPLSLQHVLRLTQILSISAAATAIMQLEWLD